MIPCLILLIHPKQLFFFVSQMKKVLQGKHFAYVEEVKQMNGRSTKKHQNLRVQRLF